MSKKRVIVIGGGIAGMESSANLAAMGHEVTLLEKSNQLGGHLLGWKNCFQPCVLVKMWLNFLIKELSLQM